MATKEDLAQLLALMREADAEQAKQSTYLAPPPDIADKMQAPASSPTTPPPPDADGSALLDHFMSTASPEVKAALESRRAEPVADPMTGSITGVSPTAEDKNTAGRAAAIGFSQGATAGFGDEIAGVAGALPGGPGYAVARDRVRERQAESQAEHPKAYGAGELGGALVTAPMLPMPGAAGVGLLAKAGAGAVGGGIYGGLSGAGHSEAADTTGLLKDTGAGAIVGAGTGAVLAPAMSLAGRGVNKAIDWAGEKVGAQRQAELAAGTSGKVKQALRADQADINELRAASAPLDKALRKHEPGAKLIELGEKSLEPLDARKAKLYSGAREKSGGGLDVAEVDQTIDQLYAKAKSEGASDSYLNRLTDLKRRAGNTAVEAPAAAKSAVPTAIEDGVDSTVRIPKQSMSDMVEGRAGTAPELSAYEKAMKNVDLLERRAVAKEAKAVSLPAAARAKQQAAADAARRVADVARGEAEALKPPRGVQKVTDADIIGAEELPGPRRVIPHEKLRDFMTKKLRPKDYNDAADAQQAQNDLYFALRDKLHENVGKHLGPDAAKELAEINKQESAWLRVMEKGDQMEGRSFGSSTTPLMDKITNKGVGGAFGVPIRVLSYVGKGAIRHGTEAVAKLPKIPQPLAQPLTDYAATRDTKALGFHLTNYLFGDSAAPAVGGRVKPEAAGAILQLARSGASRQEIDNKARELNVPPDAVERLTGQVASR